MRSLVGAWDDIAYEGHKGRSGDSQMNASKILTDVMNRNFFPIITI
jgi:hypothetical protein